MIKGRTVADHEYINAQNGKSFAYSVVGVLVGMLQDGAVYFGCDDTADASE